MIRKKVTIRDVAREAGVSPGTVSRALNRSGLVKKETRDRILAVVEKLDYRPNIIARRLSTGRTLTLKVFVPYFTRPSVTERLHGVVSALADTEYDLIIHNVATPDQRRTCFEVMPRPDEVDGALIISLTPTGEEIEALRQIEVPIVLIDVYHPDLEMFSQVYIDDVAGGRAATEYLIELGHTQIGFVGDEVNDVFNFTSSEDRHRGYVQALEAADIPVRADYYSKDAHGRLQARAQARALLTRPEPPTAIFAASDTQAVGTLQAAEDLGWTVPKDLSVIGYDNIELAEIMQLSTIQQLLKESGQLGVELLLNRLKDPAASPVHRTLPTTLVERKTTSPPPT
jgi:DNA-binding LacI/PurR family transcriptional regulator